MSECTSTKKFEVVISGFSGAFPGCSNTWDFRDKLFSKEVLLRRDLTRWNPTEHKKPFMTGRMPDVDTFDYTFMGMGSNLARGVDPILGPTLEKAVEAIFDSGVNPFSLKGRNVCVVAAASISDADMLRDIPGLIKEGNAIMNYARTMIANRLSYLFNFTGPSYSLDSSWMSAIQGLEMAANLIADGAVDSAVVTASNLTFFNSIETEYSDMGMYSTSDKCSPFDENAKGCLRSEAVVSFYLQRAEVAKRHYCTLVNAKSTCLGSRDTSFIRLDSTLASFFRDFYSHCGVDPSQVAYIETFGSGIKGLDGAELNAVSEVFGRPRPLLVGSVSGTTGNSECSSGFVSLAKAVIAMETGLLPPTVNYHSPNTDVPALLNGQIKPVTETTELSGDYVAVNCIGFSGSVGHLLTKRNSKTKPQSDAEPTDILPRLVILQARHEEGAEELVQKISLLPLDVEFISLANDIFKVPIKSYLWRAYSVLPGPGVKGAHSIQLHEPVKRPVWFIFSGMGSQWPGMGRDLLRIPVFAAAVQRCDKVLAPLGVDINQILTSGDPTIFDSVVNCFVGISMVQVGLVDILCAVGVSPDGMIGHSAGEVACGYADGGLTAEETVLAAYARGRASQDTVLVKGMMAAVGLGFETIKEKLPPSIDVACHNSADNCTLSGPAGDVLQYLEQLKNDNIFARQVNAADIAFHSRYIKKVGKTLIKSMREILPCPKPRTGRWVSSSVPQALWHTADARLCSAEYITNNLLSPVLFQEACTQLPKNAILIEISPHGLLQAILRRSISSECINVPLTSRSAESNLSYLLEAIGMLHLHNMELDVNALYPPVQYPVSRGTPSLVNLLTWDHKENLFQNFKNLMSMILNKGSSEKLMDLNENSPNYLLWKEHKIYEQVVVPFSQLLIYTFEIFVAKNQSKTERKPLVIEDVKYNKLIALNETGRSIFVSLAHGSKKFEISLDEDDTSVFISGSFQKEGNVTFSVPHSPENSSELKIVPKDDIYYMLEEVGYHLGPKLQLIKNIVVGHEGCWATVSWTGEMIVFLESLFQIVIYLQVEDTELLYQLTSFIKLTVNAPYLNSIQPNTDVLVHYNSKSNRLVCEGIEIIGIVLSPVTLEKPNSLMWSEQIYKPLGEATLKEAYISPDNVLEIADNDWSCKLKIAINNENIKGPIILLSRQSSPRHIIEMISGEPFVEKVKIVSILDKDAPKFSLGCPLYSQQLSLGLPVNILRNGRWETLTSLDLDFAENSKTSYLLGQRGAKQNYQISCIGLNSSASEEDLGIVDYSGLADGERVMGVGGVVAGEGVVTDQTLKWLVPPHWTMEQAATVPAIYSLAYYCTEELGRVQAGQNVLVTDGFSLIGQAVSAVVLQQGANIIVSVNRMKEKTEFLGIFPDINADNILVLESCDLVSNVKRLLKGQTVHVIINFLKGRELMKCSSLLYGQQQSRFVHLGQISSGDQDCIGLATFLYGNSFHGTNIKSLIRLNEQSKRNIEKAVVNGISKGVVKPLKQREFAFEDLDKAFRCQKKSYHEKAVLINEVNKDRNSVSTKLTSGEENVIMLIGPFSKQYLILARWLLKHRELKFAFVLTGYRQDCQNLYRLQRQISQQKVPSYIFLTSRLNTLDGMAELLKDVSFIGNISLIICLSMDESSDRMKNLDLASRRVLPALRQFVSLLGDGMGICQSREMAGLPVVSVKPDSTDIKIQNILPFMNTLLFKNVPKAQFLTVRNHHHHNKQHVTSTCEGYLPTAMEDWHRLGLEVSENHEWVECRTWSPGFTHVRRSLLPVFVVSALGSHKLQPLLANLINPAFCASQPVSVESTQQHAECLIDQLTTIQRKGPYNIVGDCWSGGVALALGRLLETQGHQVELFLLDGAPSVAQGRLAALCGGRGMDLSSGLLAQVFSLSEEAVTMINRHVTWEDKLHSVLETMTKYREHQNTISRGLTSLYSQLLALQMMSPPSQLFKGNITLVQTAGATLDEDFNLSKFYLQTPKLVVTEASNMEHLLACKTTASAINEECAFDWNA